jgi:hypothetical protein
MPMFPLGQHFTVIIAGVHDPLLCNLHTRARPKRIAFAAHEYKKYYIRKYNHCHFIIGDSYMACQFGI